MPRKKLTKNENSTIAECVEHYQENIGLFEHFASGVHEALVTDDHLKRYIHFAKYRYKSPERLRDKLEKKALLLPRGCKPEIDPDNLFEKVNDLAGIRIIHLHWGQIGEICDSIARILQVKNYKTVEGPVGICWDIEYEKLFTDAGISISVRDSMYLSVHYIVGMSERKPITLELQVRTLMDEVWGEVSHRVDYEETYPNKVVGDQLKVLARITSGAARLVDCIFDSHAISDEA